MNHKTQCNFGQIPPRYQAKKRAPNLHHTFDKIINHIALKYKLEIY